MFYLPKKRFVWSGLHQVGPFSNQNVWRVEINASNSRSHISDGDKMNLRQGKMLGSYKPVIWAI